MDLFDREWHSSSDPGLLALLGDFVRKTRLQENKTQTQLATEAGINRSTLVQLEQGKGANLISFIQVLRALGQLHLLRHFEVKEEISPLAMAKLEQKKRQRARRKKDDETSGAQSDW